MLTIWDFDNTEKQAYVISRGRLYAKVLYFFKRTCEKYDWLGKEENLNVNKRKTKITSRFKNMLHLWKEIPKKVC